MNRVGLSDQVRACAKAKYVHPAIIAGRRQFSIRVKDLLEQLQLEGFPARNTPQICTALQTSKVLRENGLEVEGVDGPPSKMSTTVVVRYRVADSRTQQSNEQNTIDAGEKEDPSDRALRLTEKLRGLLKEELAASGGGEAFLRWIRSEDENAA